MAKVKKKKKPPRAIAPVTPAHRPDTGGQFRVLLRPTCIVPEGVGGKVVIADEGSIVHLMDMTTMFRDRVSPVTRRADEILVGWGKPGKEQLGWLAANTTYSMRPVSGPLFLVKSRDRERLHAWDRIRYDVAQADARQKNKRRWWLVPWCMAFGKDHLAEVKKSIREFGGKVKPTDDPDAQCNHLVRLILKIEDIDMTTERITAKGAKKAAKKAATKPAKPATIKKGKQGKGKEQKGKNKVVAAESKKTAETAALNPKKFNPRTRAFDDFVIRRLVKENPRKAGTSKAKVWDKLRKGMSVKEFIGKGGTRGAVAKYISKEWVKLVRPVASDE